MVIIFVESNSPLTIDELLKFLLPKSYQSSKCPTWPPDAFAVAGFILFKSGAYLRCSDRHRPPSWQDDARSLGQEWTSSSDKNSVPKKVESWWRTISQYRQVPIESIGNEKYANLCNALLNIVAVADEACDGIGTSGRAAMMGRLFVGVGELDQIAVIVRPSDEANAGWQVVAGEPRGNDDGRNIDQKC